MVWQKYCAMVVVKLRRSEYCNLQVSNFLVMMLPIYLEARESFSRKLENHCYIYKLSALT